MDGDDLDLEFLLDAAAHEIAVLRGDPRLSPTPGKRGAALRGHLLDLLGAADHRMAGKPAASDPQVIRQAFSRSMRQVTHVLRAAHAALPWLAATESPSINLGSLYFTEECARILVGKDVDLVMVPNPEYMYSTTSWPFGAVIAATPGFTPSTSRRPIVLNYPLTDSDRLLLHPIFAHELGHASVSEHDLVSTVEAQLDADPAFTAALGGAVTQLTLLTGMPPAQASGEIRQALRSWIEESLCDHLAAEVAGPAFLWAFLSFVMPLSYAEASHDYPPNTVRVELISRHLEMRGWRDYLDLVAPGVQGWIDGIAGTSSAVLAPPYDFVRDQMLAYSAVLQDAARAVTAGEHLDPVNAIPAAEEASDLLSRLILPVGFGDRPLDLRAILVGGWQRAFGDHGDAPGTVLHGLRDDRLQQLVGKAIEMSVVTLLWRDAS